MSKISYLGLVDGHRKRKLEWELLPFEGHVRVRGDEWDPWNVHNLSSVLTSDDDCLNNIPVHLLDDQSCAIAQPRRILRENQLVLKYFHRDIRGYQLTHPSCGGTSLGSRP